MKGKLLLHNLPAYKGRHWMKCASDLHKSSWTLPSGKILVKAERSCPVKIRARTKHISSMIGTDIANAGFWSECVVVIYIGSLLTLIGSPAQSN